MTSYLALLRGINVGGKNLVKMADLREAVETMGHAEVSTFIQSGNVLFRAPRQKRAQLAERMEAGLSARFGMDLKVVLLTHAQLTRVVGDAPRGFGGKSHKCDAIFLRAPLTVGRAMAVVETREGVDRVWKGPGMIYFSRLASKASGSRLSRVVAQPEYQNMTIRSWSTTTKLLARMDPSSR
jgi:uncharacterized protein (DUF1697 family)